MEMQHEGLHILFPFAILATVGKLRFFSISLKYMLVLPLLYMNEGPGVVFVKKTHTIFHSLWVQSLQFQFTLMFVEGYFER
jgi:hypothetical protein